MDQLAPILTLGCALWAQLWDPLILFDFYQVSYMAFMYVTHFAKSQKMEVLEHRKMQIKKTWIIIISIFQMSPSDFAIALVKI